MEALVIRSADPRRWIEISRATETLAGSQHRHAVTVQLHDLRGTTMPNEDFTEDLRRLSQVFSDFAKNWPGWVGEKLWQTDDATVTLVFTHDSVGLVHLKLELEDYGADWRLTGKMTFELGSLTPIAESFERYVAAG